MLPSIEDIIAGLKEGTIGYMEAKRWFSMHLGIAFSEGFNAGKSNYDA